MTSEILHTADGSRTIRHPVHGEAYHALEGAATEAQVKFIQPTRLRRCLTEGPVRLLDVGLGLGINCRAALACADQHDLEIDTLEVEPEALERGLRLASDDPLLKTLRASEVYRPGRARVTLHLGDLREVLPRLSGPYDVIFHDPFSPLKNTEAWTVEVFRLLRERAAPNAVLATYSESRVVRSGLVEAGWHVGETPAVEPHRGGTLAAVDAADLPHPLDPESFRTEPYRDATLSDDASTIRARRESVVRERGVDGITKR